MRRTRLRLLPVRRSRRAANPLADGEEGERLVIARGGEGAAGVGGHPLGDAAGGEDLGLAAGRVEIALEGALAEYGAGDFLVRIEHGADDGGDDVGKLEVEDVDLVGARGGEGGSGIGCLDGLGALEEFLLVEDACLLGEVGLDEGGHGLDHGALGLDGLLAGDGEDFPCFAFAQEDGGALATGKVAAIIGGEAGDFEGIEGAGKVRGEAEEMLEALGFEDEIAEAAGLEMLLDVGG